LASSQGLETTTININGTNAMTTSAGGTMDQTWDTTYPSTATEWTNWQALYQEYRVLAMEFQYVPKYTPGSPADATTVLSEVGVATVEHKSITGPGPGIASMVENPTWKVWHPMKPLKLTWKMAGSDESQFRAMATSSNLGGFRVYIQGLSNSTLYGRVFIRVMVQLRGRI